MNDSWTDQPYGLGAVLVGDAAGWNDPIIGQGLSIAMRDARIVSDILRSTSAWGPSSFAGYAEERRERMRRLRIGAAVVTDIRATFGPESIARRRAFFASMATDTAVAGLLLAAFVGPERVPAEAFETQNIDRILALS